jgi:hypothetical protein
MNQRSGIVRRSVAPQPQVVTPTTTRLSTWPDRIPRHRNAERQLLCLSFIEPLQQFVGCELKFLVPPFRRSKLTRDETHPMDTAEVSVHEPVSGFGVLVRAIGETQVPFTVFIPRVGLEKGVFVVGSWLTLTPVALHDVLAGVN